VIGLHEETALVGEDIRLDEQNAWKGGLDELHGRRIIEWLLMTDNAAERRREWRLAGVIFFSLIAIVVLWTAARIVWPFISAILIGGILVILTFPMYQRVRAGVGGHGGLAAAIMLVAITLVLILPFFILTLLLVQQANALIQHLQSGEAQAILARIDLSQHLEFVRRYVPGFDPANVSPQRLILPIVRELPGWVARNGGAVLGGLRAWPGA